MSAPHAWPELDVLTRRIRATADRYRRFQDLADNTRPSSNTTAASANPPLIRSEAFQANHLALKMHRPSAALNPAQIDAPVQEDAPAPRGHGPRAIGGTLPGSRSS